MTRDDRGHLEKQRSHTRHTVSLARKTYIRRQIYLQFSLIIIAMVHLYSLDAYNRPYE